MIVPARDTPTTLRRVGAAAPDTGVALVELVVAAAVAGRLGPAYGPSERSAAAGRKGSRGARAGCEKVARGDPAAEPATKGGLTFLPRPLPCAPWVAWVAADAGRRGELPARACGCAYDGVCAGECVNEGERSAAGCVAAAAAAAAGAGAYCGHIWSGNGMGGYPYDGGTKNGMYGGMGAECGAPCGGTG